MRILRRYLTRQIVTSVALVLIGLLMLFSFFDLIQQLEDVAKGRYPLMPALLWEGRDGPCASRCG